MQTKSHTRNEDRACMGNREAADEGKKVLSHCSFSQRMTAELSLGSLTAVFAIFILSKEELSVLHIQGNSYM